MKTRIWTSVGILNSFFPFLRLARQGALLPLTRKNKTLLLKGKTKFSTGTHKRLRRVLSRSRLLSNFKNKTWKQKLHKRQTNKAKTLNRAAPTPKAGIHNKNEFYFPASALNKITLQNQNLCTREKEYLGKRWSILFLSLIFSTAGGALLPLTRKSKTHTQQATPTITN